MSPIKSLRLTCRFALLLVPVLAFTAHLHAQAAVPPPDAPLAIIPSPPSPTLGADLVTGFGVFNLTNNSKLDYEHSTQLLAAAEWRFPELRWSVRPWLGAAFAERGTWFLSGGLIYTLPFDSGWRFSLSFAPTYYQPGAGLVLGETLEFYSFAEVGYAFANQQSLNLRLGHISNAHLSDYNPGTEVLMLSWTIPFH